MLIRGVFITIDGVSGCGKTLQCLEFKNRCSAETFVIELPYDSTYLGKILCDIRDKKIQIDPMVYHFMCAAHRREVVDVISEKIYAGINVICTGYFIYNISHVMSKMKNNIACSDELMTSEIGLIIPDLMIHLSFDPVYLDKTPNIDKSENDIHVEDTRNLIKNMNSLIKKIQNKDGFQHCVFKNIEATDSVDSITDTVIYEYKKIKVCSNKQKIFIFK
jgi:thymidylate kinase